METWLKAVEFGTATTARSTITQERETGGGVISIGKEENILKKGKEIGHGDQEYH